MENCLGGETWSTIGVDCIGWRSAATLGVVGAIDLVGGVTEARIGVDWDGEVIVRVDCIRGWFGVTFVVVIGD